MSGVEEKLGKRSHRYLYIHSSCISIQISIMYRIGTKMPENDLTSNSNRMHTREQEEDDGLIPRSICYLFRAMESKKDTVKYAVKASYCEIYNEQVYIEDRHWCRIKMSQSKT